ncbi:hypothetical protein HMPREF1983_01029 [Gemella bergeri ATCC 700627]|uniref:Uncharacterized protein n=1 Tax=Gemella bergeri ATCC 700627 TaxID=1321820 RepID=U2QNB6_9BACL|nr:hypothetical protein HMPREF1983_01029 [Gemella bergeri ATCC 700627]
MLKERKEGIEMCMVIILIPLILSILGNIYQYIIINKIKEDLKTNYRVANKIITKEINR